MEINVFLLFNVTLKIDLVEVVYLKQVFHLLSKLYDKSVTPMEPLLYFVAA